MKFLIHYSVGEFEDSFVIEGESLDEIREKSTAELNRRGATDQWSEELNP